MKIGSKKFLFGFSLVEILVALIAVSCIMTALAPVITKKLKSNAVTVGSLGGKMEFILDCSPWGDDCVFCTEEKCSLCSKECNDNEFVYTQDCVCKNCTEITPNCIRCSAKKCKKCQSGYGLTNTNKCELCQAGTYSDGTTACQKAPAGYYVANSGASSATPCAVGTYQDEEGKTSCKTCGAGTYQNETGKTSCKTCEIDYMCTGGNNRTQCALDYGANAGSSSCTACPSYCADCQVPNTCLKCNAGFYLSNNTCYPCTVGYSCDGSATQTSCPAGYYSGAGASACSACSAGTYSNGGVSSCSSCSAGTYSSAGASSCTNCSAGYYSGASASSCTQCSAGYYSSAGASSCTACSSGYYSSAGASSCTACSTTWANCTTCTASGCSACASGYEVKDGACVIASGPPRNQADCDPYGALFIASEHNNGNPAVCATKFNAGDTGGPAISGNVAVVATKQGCYTGNCCWTGHTSHTCGASGNHNSTYSGCYRTVCQHAAAYEICNNYAPSTKATNWRLPLYSEVYGWIQNANAVNNHKGTAGLQLCDWNSDSYGSVRCNPKNDRCIGAGAWADGNTYDVCAAAVVWTEDYTTGGLATNYGITSWNYAISTYALSVRCVTSDIEY